MTQKQFHEETTTVRIYGRTLTQWWENRETGECTMNAGCDIRKERDWHWKLTQTEKEYTEYRLNGEIKQTGSRDIRWSSYRVSTWEVKTWNGKDTWKNGFHSYKVHRHVTTDAETKKSDLLRVLKLIDSTVANAADVRLG